MPTFTVMGLGDDENKKLAEKLTEKTGLHVEVLTDPLFDRERHYPYALGMVEQLLEQVLDAADAVLDAAVAADRKRKIALLKDQVAYARERLARVEAAAAAIRGK